MMYKEARNAVARPNVIRADEAKVRLLFIFGRKARIAIDDHDRLLGTVSQPDQAGGISRRLWRDDQRIDAS
jgi:hypothetical protein